MKNLFLTFILLMTISISFGKGSKNLVESCRSYAISSANAEEGHYGPMSDKQYMEAVSWYLDACNEAGGASHMLPAI